MVLLLGNNFFICSLNRCTKSAWYLYHTKTDVLYSTVLIPCRFHTPVGTVRYKSVMFVPTTTTSSVSISQKQTRFFAYINLFLTNYKLLDHSDIHHIILRFSMTITIYGSHHLLIMIAFISIINSF